MTVRRATRAEVMAIYDGLPEEWRALAQEHDLNRVLKLYIAKATLDEARDYLVRRRAP